MLLLDVKQSRIETALVLLLQICALLAVWLSGLREELAAWFYLLTLAMILHFWSSPQTDHQRYLRRVALGPESAWLEYREQGITNKIHSRPPVLEYHSQILLALRFDLEGHCQFRKCLRLRFWPDSLNRENQRHLRRYLKYGLTTAG